MPEDDHTRRAVRHVPVSARRSDTAQSPGMTRFEGISGRTVGAESIWLGENHVSPGVRSANHHHGASESAIYVVSGNPVFVYWEDGAEHHVHAGPGDYVFVPPYLPHREENPGTGEAVVVLARSTQEAIVVNLDRLDEDVPIGSEGTTTTAAEDGWHRTEGRPGDAASS